MQISKKQKQAIELAFNPEITEMLLGGAAGGAKSYTVCMISILAIKQFPGVRIFIGRKTLKSLKQSTITTLLNKVHPDFGISPSDFTFHSQDMTIDYLNGSTIIFGELCYQPGDDTYSRLGSLEIDFAIVEEAGEVVEKAFSVIKSRTGRGVMTKQYNIPGFILATCNPSQNFLRQEYYDPYVKLGGGGFQKWPIGEITINEGTSAEDKKPAYRAFLRMDSYDNPFIPQSYIDNLKSLPDVERRRLLDGDWNYADDTSSLFRAGLLDKAISYELPKETGFNKVIGVDVAGEGGDSTVYSLIVNGVLVTQKKSDVQTNWQKTDQRPLFRLMADELIAFAQQNGFTQKEARRIAVEENGIGNALRDCVKERGWYITEYTATSKSRSENYYQLMLDMDSGAVKISSELNGLDELRRELGVHTFEFDNQTPKVLKKDKLKQRLGHSPDFADSFCIANYVRNLIDNPSLDPRRNSSRIAW